MAILSGTKTHQNALAMLTPHTPESELPNSIEILQQAIELLQETKSLLHRIETEYLQPQPGQTGEWVDKHQASKLLGVHWQTLYKWTKDDRKGLMEGVHWTNNGYEVLYHRELLADWYRNRHDPSAHLRLVESYQRSRAASTRSKQPRKRSA
ncbi:hypothetical protein ACQ4M3_40410 [Leptolyngbya sp. AN03gr2]|uniref:hypothetical protein n=1 Tax=unclassified Leptolyngbya TaxID=2650499 RepID=UPI003D323B05